MEAKKSNFGVSYGLISALASILFTLILYIAGAKWFVSSVAYIGFLIPISFAVLAGLKQKKVNGGYLEFSEALKVTFTCFVIAALLSTLFSYVLLNYIDVNFRQAMAQESMEKIQSMMKSFGASQDQIDKAMDEAVKGNSYSMGKMMLGTAFSFIFWFLVSLIIAAIIKKKKPEFGEFMNQPVNP